MKKKEREREGDGEIERERVGESVRTKRERNSL